jgi:hypothetical protein
MRDDMKVYPPYLESLEQLGKERRRKANLIDRYIKDIKRQREEIEMKKIDEIDEKPADWIIDLFTKQKKRMDSEEEDLFEVEGENFRIKDTEVVNPFTFRKKRN